MEDEGREEEEEPQDVTHTVQTHTPEEQHKYVTQQYTQTHTAVSLTC